MSKIYVLKFKVTVKVAIILYRNVRIKNKRMNQRENVLLLCASDFHVCICFIIFKNSMNHMYHLSFFLDQNIAYFVNS